MKTNTKLIISGVIIIGAIYFINAVNEEINRQERIEMYNRNESKYYDFKNIKDMSYKYEMDGYKKYSEHKMGKTMTITLELYNDYDKLVEIVNLSQYKDNDVKKSTSSFYN